jgi:hypothetical protein
MNDIMNENDYDNPFIECELCETMVRFNDYNSHIEQCSRFRTQYVPPFILPFYRHFGQLTPISNPEENNNEEEGAENNEGQESEETQTPSNMETGIDFNFQVETQTPSNIETGIDFNFQYVFQIPTVNNSNDHGEEEGENNENDDMPELVESDNDAEHDIENPPPYNQTEIPVNPLNYQIHFNFSVPLSSLPPLPPLEAQMQNHENIHHPQTSHQDQDEHTGDTENEDNSTEPQQQSSNLPVVQNFQQILQNIRQGNVQVSDIASFILNENLIQNEELIPLLSNHIRRQQETQQSAFRQYPFEMMQNNQQTQTQQPHQLPSLASLLPPFPLVDEYEYNLMLANRLGKVERGIKNIDEVSKIIEEYEANDICPICQDTIEDIRKDENMSIRKTICDHIFCDKCIKTWLEKNVRCPVCNEDLDDMVKMKKIL